LPATNLQAQEYKFNYRTLSGVWTWKTRVDLSQPIPMYQVADIVSPYGLLRDSIPIPGEVVQSMASSIEEIKLAFAPSILVGPPSSLVFTVDEGRGFSVAQPVQVTNNGVYGSLLSLSLTTSSPWLKAVPASLGHLAFNESATFDTSVDSTNLLAAQSPYSGTVMLQDVNASNSPQSVPITVNVRPKALISLTPVALYFVVSKPVSGPFPPIPAQQFTVQNTGPANSVLEFLIQKLLGMSDWLVAYTPSTGSLASSASQAVTVTVQPPESTLTGTYIETLRVSGYSENAYQDIEIQLIVT
jgi:hypothetical protein